VVDANCRVHSVNNLFVAGSSVFPTSSQANPTLTLIAVSLRLASHLRQRLDRKAVAVVEEALA
jgi:choline dehydrogenase-like flavoprotein